MHKLITKKVIETIHLSEGRGLLLRDTELKGFGIRISPSGTKTFFAEGNFNRSRQTKRRSLGRYPFHLHAFKDKPTSSNHFINFVG